MTDFDLVSGVQGTLYSALGPNLVHVTGPKHYDICQPDNAKVSTVHKAASPAKNREEFFGLKIQPDFQASGDGASVGAHEAPLLARQYAILCILTLLVLRLGMAA